MKEVVKVLNLIFCFTFGFFTTNYFFTGMSEMWKLYVGLGALVCAISGFVLYAKLSKKRYN